MVHCNPEFFCISYVIISKNCDVVVVCCVLHLQYEHEHELFIHNKLSNELQLFGYAVFVILTFSHKSKINSNVKLFIDI